VSSQKNPLSYSDSEPGKTVSQSNLTDVLLLEDDFHTARAYSKVLAHADFSFDIAATLDEARVLLDSKTYNIFICDIQVGKDSGLDLLEEYHHKLEKLDTKIVVASAYGNYHYMTEELGTDFFLHKPVSLEVFLVLIKRLMEGK
jgi:DNA-binding response OmpR family regulator